MPSLLLQTCLIYQHGLLNADVTAVPIGLAITQLIVAGTTIALTTLVLSMPTSGIIAAAPAPQPPPPLATSSVKCADEEKMITAFPSRLRQKEERGCSGHQCIITAVRSICLLWCRTVAVGVFMTEFHVWTLIVFGVHWCITLLWLVLQDSASELPHSGYTTAPPSPAVSLFRRALVAYLLVFDWPPRYQPKHSGWSASHKAVNPAAIVPAVGSWLDVVGLGGEPRSVAVALYYGISGVENAAMLSLWFHFAPPSILVPPVARLTTLATCTAALTLGVLCVVASTQGPDEETPSSSSSSSATLTSNRTTYTTSDSTSLSASSASNTSSLKPAATAFVPPCSVTQQREIRTVVAQVHPPRLTTTTRLTQAALNMAANHSHPPMEPPPPPPPETTWERAISVCDDESSNSRNTNTMDGALTMGPGSGSGSCPSPPLYNVAISGGLVASSSSPVVNMSTHPVPVRSHQASPFRDPSTFTASQNSYRVAKTVGTAGLAKTSAVLAQQMDGMVKRPYLSGCPLSSTPRLVRRNSSFGSSLMIKSARSTAVRGGICKNGIRSAHTTGRHRRRHRTHQNHHNCRPRGSKGACHCRIFDDYGMGILIKENPISKSGTLTSGGRNSSGRLSHGLFTTAETDASKPQLQIRCAKCLGAHDPLLTNCIRSKRQSMAAAKATGSGVKSKTLPSRHHKITGVRQPHVQLDTSMCSTNYPSDTEVTCTGGRRSVSSSSGSSTDGSSSSSLDSDATYTTWPPSIRIPSMERLLSENTDPSPWNYVHAWLVNANQPQTRPRPLPTGAASGTATGGRVGGTNVAIGTAKRIVKRLGGSPTCGTAQTGQVQYLMRPHRHNHQAAVGGVQDVYSAYCTVPPRLGQTVKELSVVRRSQKSSVSPAVEHQYSTPSVVQYSTPTSSTTSTGLEIVV